MKKAKPCKADRCLWIIIPAVILIDQLTKYFFSGADIQIIKNVFYFNYVCNTGAAFSILQNMNVYLIWFSLIVLGLIIYFYPNVKRKCDKIAVFFIVSGIMGNLIDRISFGCVRDFMDFRIWPVFNIADSALVVGVMLLIFYSFQE